MFRIPKPVAAGAVFGVLAFGVSQAEAVTIANSTTGFVDSSSLTRDVTFSSGDFSGSTTVGSITVSVSFAKNDGQSFRPEGTAPSSGTAFFNEIELVLTSPTGTHVTLISNDGGTEIVPADNFSSFNSGSGGFAGTILFDQSAAQTVNVNPNVVQAGTFRPDDNSAGNLNDFLGETALGTWQLFVEDDVGLDGLSFYSFAVNINAADGNNAVPEPMSLALLGAGLVGLGAARRRRAKA